MTAMLKRRLPTPPVFPLDATLFTCVFLIIAVGLIMVSSASVELSARNYGSPHYMLTKHAVFLGISVTVGLAALATPVAAWQKIGLPLLITGFALLIAVLIPGVGREVNGSVRWIPLGFFTVQGSEFLKVFLVIYLAGYLVKHNGLTDSPFTAFIKPLAIVMGLVFLLMVQPDFGASVVVTTAVMGVIFLAGAPLKFFMPLVVCFSGAAALLVTLQPYRLMRITSFTDPWEHQFDGGYQLTQALIAFGRGDLFGLGLGNSIQKLFFLPEAHTDFLFSILAEELGVVGAGLVILLFCVFIIRALWVGKKAQMQGQHFHAYIAFGTGLMLGIQACINLGVNLGLLPTKGITLPLMSYGGNSLIVSCMMVGLLLRVEYECRTPIPAKKRGGRGKS
jgi:cell division protein FtsW